MLEGLDRVDWSNLTHAYGSAADVPGQIRALTSPRKADRDEACWKLFGNIFHQGTRYPASPYAVPFLLELLRDPRGELKQELIELLVGLAIGYPEDGLPDGPEVEVWSRSAASENEEERGFGRAYLDCLRAVREGVPDLVHLLSHGEVAVRRRAALALYWFREEAATVAPALDLVIRTDRDEVVVACALISLGSMDHFMRDEATLELCRSRMGNGERPLVSGAAAVAQAIALRPAVPAEVIDRLTRAVAARDPALRRTGLPWFDGDLAQLAEAALGWCGRA